MPEVGAFCGTGSWGSLGWTYDGVGNRLTENSNSYTYFSNTNKLSSANGKSFGYDNNGNTTSEAARIYTYNQNQRLIQVVDGAMTANYNYNGSGQRVKKNVSGIITIFHYSPNGQIIAESNSVGSITAEYVYLNSQPLAKIEGANVYYYHNDHLATPQKLTDGTRAVVWSADYKPFGEATITISTITNNLRFPGQYYDAETGLNYNYYRDYNPVIGRYIEADPIGLAGGSNLYVYAYNNPVRFTDPDGLDPSGGPNASLVPAGYCNGEWRQVGWDRVANAACKCYWTCVSCSTLNAGGGWSYTNPDTNQRLTLPSTPGYIINSPQGKGAGVKRGDDCFCDKPGPDKNCKKCENK